MEAVPGWRKPIALVGWAVLIAALIAVIVWGINQLAQGPGTPAAVTTTTAPPPAAVTTTTSTTATTTGTTTAPTADTDATSTTPTTTTDTGAPTKSRSQGAFPHLPSVITLPSLPAITLPPGR
jgi:cytoskeletal protein RodZ